MTTNPAKWRSRNGFALITTISLLTLLALISIGLLSVSTVTVRSASLGEAQAEARANARLALLMAIGELQKTMGPDQAISARALTLAQDPRVGASVASDTPKAWWVGVSHSDPDIMIGPNGQPVVWLVSGLDPSAESKTQIGGEAFVSGDAIRMIGERSLDLATHTGGKVIEAGRVPLIGSSDRDAGGLAYFIDDNGMKAQLAASHSEARNDLDPQSLGGGVLPGSYDIGILEKMDSLEGTDVAEYARLGSMRDLPFVGGTLRMTKEKYFSYTPRSRGVLSDLRKGGLKKDLTIAFEVDRVFNSVFPSRDPLRYIVMDAGKLRDSAARSLKDNGYIHFEIFKDYYNIKKFIYRRGAQHMLDHHAFSKDQLFSNFETPFGKGQLGPHEIGGSSTPSLHREQPYGDFNVLHGKPSDRKSGDYKHSPVIPILSQMQINGWVEVKPPASQNGRSQLETHVQLWTSHYNPYNVSLNIRGDNEARGPRIINYPQVRFSLGSALRNENGFAGKRQSHCDHAVILDPGRSHVHGFKADGARGQENDGRLYSDQVQRLTNESITTQRSLTRELNGPQDLKVEFFMDRPSIMHGQDDVGGPLEVSQVFFSPFGWDAIDRQYPGKIITQTVDAGELGQNSMAKFTFALRSTREGSKSIRPLVDANIRAPWCNPKWDVGMGLPLLAAYTPAGSGEASERYVQMVTERGEGFSYWGGGRESFDGYDRVILFDIPRDDLVSLGQLQHAGAGRFSYEPSYIVGNSYANPRLPLDDWQARVTDDSDTRMQGLRNWRITSAFFLYDSSYLVNEALFDSYIFTTIPQVQDNYPRPERRPDWDALLSGEDLLANPRFLPYQPAGLAWDEDTLQDVGNATTGSFFHNAGLLMVDGAFNVNSTSVDAWEAFLSGTHGLPVLELTRLGAVAGFSEPPSGVRFPRVKTVYGTGKTSDRLDNESFWTGFRDLEQKEVRQIATALVDEIKRRGPFLTLGEFINRKLESGENGQKGALQAALDATVNQGLDADLAEAATHPQLPANSSQGAGFPGQLLQGDVLQALAPYMTARSDSFTIRAYGESRNSANGQVQARAWCEAVVQRYPDPLPDSKSDGSALEELSRPSSRFGRDFRVSSFRWLSPEEI